MKLLKIYFDHMKMFKNGIMELDLFASDKVPASDESVAELARPIYSNNIIALAGINASGKTTALNLIELACRIVDGSPINGAGLPSAMPSLFDGPSTFRCLAWHDKNAYLIESVLACGKNVTESGRDGFAIHGEVVSRIPGRALKKSTLASWEELRAVATDPVRRSELSDAWSMLASPDVSIAAAVVARDVGERCRIVSVRDGGFRLRESFEGLDDVLRVFDARIEHLEVRDSGRVFVLTFTGEEPMLLSEDGLNEVLSSGTARGVALVQRALHVLGKGGYLLVDEIENHLNRQLVNVIVDLFAEKATNPKGATLVFTTHYPQLLDHVHRKDNVFFLVHGKEGAEVVKYGDRVERIENKKSEVFISNYIKGTAPRYTDVRALKGFVSGAVSHD